jgi:hypothetical protein
MPKKNKDIISRCGFKCNLCLAYRENVKSDADRERFRNGLLKYYGYPLKLEDCICDGCLADDSRNPILLTPACRVRRCVLKKGLENCADCELYPCRTLEKKFIDGKKVVEKYGAPIPKKEYERFVAPYENKKILDAIRKEKKQDRARSR